MTKIVIQRDTPLSDDAAWMIKGSEEALRAVYLAEECFTFSASELDRPEISFFVARQDGVALGCVALVNCGSYSEVKRLYVPPAGRRSGLAKALMTHLETVTTQAGTTSIKLETGEKLVAAVALYKSMGYEICGPFGNYTEQPASLFMEKRVG